jgi:hypothetical protein
MACGALIGETFDEVDPASSERSGTNPEEALDAASTPATAADEPAFVQEACAIVAQCCAKNGYAPDGETCREFYQPTATRPGRTFSPSRGAHCLARLRHYAEHGCIAFDLLPPQCLDVTEGGNTAPGEPCTTPSDCRISTEGDARCQSMTVEGKTTRRCQVHTAAPAGAPCQGNLQIEGSPAVDTTDAFRPQVALCPFANGLYCDTDKRCRPFVPLGGSCGTTAASGGACAVTAFCDEQQRCVAPLAVGAPCTGHSRCVVGAKCDATTSRCVVPASEGSPCTLDDECPRRMCVNGTCANDSVATQYARWCGAAAGK